MLEILSDGDEKRNRLMKISLTISLLGILTFEMLFYTRLEETRDKTLTLLDEVYSIAKRQTEQNRVRGTHLVLTYGNWSQYEKEWRRSRSIDEAPLCRHVK